MTANDGYWIHTKTRAEVAAIEADNVSLRAELAALKAAPVAVPEDESPLVIRLRTELQRLRNVAEISAFYVIHSIESILDAYEPSAPSAAAGVAVPEDVRKSAEYWAQRIGTYTRPEEKHRRAYDCAKFILSLPTAAGASQPEPAAQPDEELQRLLEHARAGLRETRWSFHSVAGQMRATLAVVEALARKAGAK